MVPDFSVYFDVKSLSFTKINPCKTSKLQYLWKLKQAKILQCKCRFFCKLSFTVSHLHSIHWPYSIFGHREFLKEIISEASLLHFRVCIYSHKVKEKSYVTKTKCDITSTKYILAPNNPYINRPFQERYAIANAHACTHAKAFRCVTNHTLKSNFWLHIFTT